MIKKPTLALIAGLFLSSAAQAADLPTSTSSATNSPTTTTTTAAPTMMPANQTPDIIAPDTTAPDTTAPDTTAKSTDKVSGAMPDKLKTSPADPKGTATKPDASGPASQ